jgi:hypothetical protein
MSHALERKELFVPSSSTSSPPPVTAKIEKMLAAAEEMGVDIFNLELTRRRLVAHGAERQDLGPSPRRTELDELMGKDIDDLRNEFNALARAIDVS